MEEQWRAALQDAEARVRAAEQQAALAEERHRAAREENARISQRLHSTQEKADALSRRLEEQVELNQSLRMGRPRRVSAMDRQDSAASAVGSLMAELRAITRHASGPEVGEAAALAMEGGSMDTAADCFGPIDRFLYRAGAHAVWPLAGRGSTAGIAADDQGASQGAALSRERLEDLGRTAPESLTALADFITLLIRVQGRQLHAALEERRQLKGTHAAYDRVLHALVRLLLRFPHTAVSSPSRARQKASEAGGTPSQSRKLFPNAK